MDIVLHSLTKNQGAGGIESSVSISVSFGSEPVKVYRASYQDFGSRGGNCEFEPELAERLRSLSWQRHGNPAYVWELTQIIRAFVRGEPILELPAKLGTTAFFPKVLNRQDDAFEFIALVDSSGQWTYPQVPGIPDWYFQNTSICAMRTKPETKEADLAKMKSYNDTLYQTLKAQGKLHYIEERIARVKANLDKQQQSK
jgi:hypothetical protein